MQMKNVEDIYPLSPPQQGMLFHTLYAPQSGIYCEQLGMTFHSPLERERFKEAWQYVIERHPILRTAFVWEGLDEPLQIVRRRVEIPWEEYDWQGGSASEQAARLQAFLQADRSRGFDLAHAPLMRLTLLRLSPETAQCIWSYHHLLLDGVSTNLILHEVFACYQALQQGQMSNLPRPRPYRDYIAWLQEQDLTAAEAFWRQYLKGFTAPTPLVVDQPSGAGASATEEGSGEYEIRLSRERTSALQAFARQHQLTLNTLLQGAWALLLSRYSGEIDVVFGITVSTRPATLVGAESMVGVFINSLPLRVQVSPEEQVLAYLKKVQVAQIEARQYDYSPLVQVQGWSETPRGQPIFESLLVFENYSTEAAQTEPDEERRLVDTWWGKERATYPLTLTVSPHTELMLRVGYELARFDEQTIQRLLGHLLQLLEGMLAGPEQQLEAIPLLTVPERHQLLLAWNHQPARASDDLAEACLHELFEAQAARTPDAVAVAYGDCQVTYAELNARANQVARYLSQRGVRSEILVGLCVERSVEMIVGLLGILKAGGAYVPLDPSYPPERLAFMLVDAHAPVLLTQEALSNQHASTLQSSSTSPQVILLDADWPQIAQESTANLASGVYPANLAYTIYTSGSTGRPKGVIVSHRGLGNLARAQIDAFAVTLASRVLQFASPSFDAAVSELAMALLAGGTLCLDLEPILHSAPDLLRMLREQSITTVTLPPSLLAVLPVEELPALRTIVVAGEVCQPEWLARWAAEGRHLRNAYGPTEVTVCATIMAWDGSRPNLPIGRPIANTVVYLLDQQMQPVPIGVPGELYLGGIGLARGYLGRPDLTAERFVPHPFVDEKNAGARLYKTGDLARYLPDGNLEFVGRRDTQVKVRGYRIELEEIEARLAAHPAVQAATVVVWEDHTQSVPEALTSEEEEASGEKRLVAYLVFQPGKTLTSHQLYDFLQQQLPAYMIPSVFVELKVLPLTPSGKVDRRALPSPDEARVQTSERFVPPRNSVEEELAQIWADVLGLERVSVEDNFFELGGHSLLATQVTSRIREALQIEMPVWTIFETLTIAELAKAIILKELEEAESDVLAEALEQGD
ncbi:MAG TPA: amino acid adenylation domain-containing protein [Ktedonobacterales bacterium]|nr:amino acid adenylation domain-containing protein [Ktedonobacterales bacterium]